jgi:hypothetical protein
MAAVIAREYNADIKLVPASHPFHLSEICDAVRNRHVLFVDIAPPSIDALKQIATVAASIYILDHHESAMREYAFVDGRTWLPTETGPGDSRMIVAPHWCFDMDKSGAMLAWRFFCHRFPVNTMVQVIDLHDRGEFSDNINAIMALHWQDDLTTGAAFNKYTSIYRRGVWSLAYYEEQVKAGKEVMLQWQAEVNKQIIEIRDEIFNGKKIPVCYVCPAPSPKLWKLMVDRVKLEHKAVIIAFVAYDSVKDITRFSLRRGWSDINLTDVTHWCHTTGLACSGGGHAGAAGMVRNGRCNYMTSDRIAMTTTGSAAVTV